MLRKNRFFTFVIIFSLFMGAAFASSALLITSKLIQHKQLQQKALIEQLLHSNLTEDAKVLSKQLRASVDFEFLTITDTDNNVLYRYIKDHKQRPALSYLLKHFDLYTPVQRVKTNQGKLVLEFQSSFSQVLTPLSLIVAVALIAPIMMTLLIYMIAEFVQDKRLEKLSKQLESRLVAKETILPKQQLNKFEYFLPLIEQLEKTTPTSELNVEISQHKALPTGAEFIDLYQSRAKDKGYFILIRVSELTNLTLKQNYQLSDIYMQLVTDAIAEVFSPFEDCFIYKLNSCDFGLLNFQQSLPWQQLSEQLTTLVQSELEQQSISGNITVSALPFDATTELDQLLTKAEQIANSNIRNS